MGQNYLNIKKQMADEQKRLSACKTKEDLNELYKGRTIIVQDGSDWHNERCEFVEMMGEGSRENWKMKIRTQFGTFLELSGNKVMIVIQTITTSDAEAEKIRKSLTDE